MNHIYRIVWSHARQAWVVVSEVVRGRGKRGGGRRAIRRPSARLAALLAGSVLLPLQAWAVGPVNLPAPGDAYHLARVDVVRGQAIQPPAGATAPEVRADVVFTAPVRAHGDAAFAGAGHARDGRATSPRPGSRAWRAPTGAPTTDAAFVGAGHARDERANANPTGGNVTAGSGHIDQAGNTTTITQDSQNLSLTWDSFDIGADSSVTFLQPNELAIAINRILGNDASTILGRLDANGRVFLINPNGVLFGEGAQVNVGGLVASTLDIDDHQLGSDTLRFSGDSTASIVNQGTLTAANGGYIALLGHHVSNQGTIRAQLGTVALAGGNAVTLNFDGIGLAGVQVEQSALDALVENRQLIVADGGQVLMTAGAKDSLLASVVNNTGVVQARTVEHRDGRIILLGGMTAGTTHVDGTLDASAPDGGDGGFIETSAAHVQVADGARITTLASDGDTGTWLIDPQDYTIAATGGDISGATLSTNLGTTSVEIQSATGTTAGSGDIDVDDAVTWSADTVLTLTASDDVNINADLTATGNAAGLVLNPNTTNGADTASGDGVYTLNNGASITLSGLNPSLSIAGQAYIVINSLGAAGDATSTSLQGIDNNLGGHYALGSDLDASATTGWNDDGGGNFAGFDPIGDNGSLFTGSFDGLGHTITGLTIDRPATDFVGLFGYTGSSTIRNLGLLGGSVTGQNYVGGLVGRSGFGTITETYATGAVTGTSEVGGLVGANDGTITQAWATGAVSGSTYVGGLVGFNDNGTISQTYATGAVDGNNAVGGLVGNNNSTISQSYATGAVTGTSDVGGLVGLDDFFGTTTISYWATDTSGQAGSAGGTGMLAAGLIAALPPGFDAAVWGNQDNQTTPYLLDNIGPVFVADDLTGVGTNLYTPVLTLDELQAIDSSLAGNYALFVDIDASATASWNDDGSGNFAGFDPIGDNTTKFTGSFDGLGHSISGLTIDRPLTEYVGLFGYASSSAIRNLGLLGGSVTGQDSVGGLVGRNGGAITQAYSTGAVSGNNYVGGLVGGNAGGTITQSHATGTVSGTGDRVGGLVGINDHSTITQAYATGAVSGNEIVGGLVGHNFGGTISQAYATGAVDGTNIVGGLVGFNNNAGTISDSYWDTQTTGQAGSDGGTAQTTAQLQTGLPSGFDASVWGIVASESYPYLLSQFAPGATPQVVSGIVYNDGDTTAAAAGIEVSGLVDGNALTSVLTGGTVDTGANGYYYYLLAPGTLSGGNDVLTHVAAGGSLSNGGAALADNADGSIADLDIYDDALHTVTESTALSTVQTNLGAAIGSDATAAALIAGLSDLYIDAASAFNLDLAYTLNGDLVLDSDSDDSGDGGISQSAAIAVTGTSAFDANTGAIALTDTDNDFGGAVSLSNSGANNVAITDSNALVLGDVSVGTGTLSVQATHLTQAAATSITQAVSAGAASFNAGTGDLTLANAGNDFTSAVSLTGDTAQINDANDLTLRNVQTTSLIASAGSITLNGAIASTSIDLDASGSIGINTVIVNPATSLVLEAGTTITVTQAIDVDSFTLESGTWSQLGTLPGFSADSFTLTGGTFIRALGGDGSSADPYRLTDVYGLQGVDSAGMLGNFYALANDIDASGTAGWNGSAGFDPIGDTTTQFTGSFDGLGHTISGLFINRPATDYVGLFGYADSSTIRNLGLLGGSITGHDSVGGLVGYNDAGTISQAYATGAVGGTQFVGGLVGVNDGTISQAWATGTVSGVNSVGGLVGINDGTISQAYATGTVSGVNSVGGLVGSNFSGTISQTYATGAVSGDQTLGGLVGYNLLGTISDSYWATDTTGQASSFGGSGLTTDEMMDAASFAAWTTDISAAGGSSAVWRIYEGHTAPLLRVFMTDLTVTADDVVVTYNATAYAGSTDYSFGTITPGIWHPSTTVDPDLLLGNANTSAPAVNAGSYALAGDGLYSSQLGYDISYAAGTLTIDPLAITVDATASDKVYDATTAATASLASTGVLGTDVVSFTSTSASFDDKHAGVGKTVTVTGIAASGADAGNYSVNASDTDTADISQLAITVAATASDKVYDATTAATTMLASTGILGTDVVSFTSTSASFADKNAGTGKTVTVTGISASGADAGNYSFNTSDTDLADISQRAITVDATASDKVYDATTAATTTLASTGILTGDTVTFTGTGTFDNKNVGTGKIVTVTGIATGGTDGGNYSVNASDTDTADLSQLAITVAATASDKVYDATTAATASLASSGILAGDTVTFTGTGSFADKNAGVDKIVTVTGIAAGGTDGGNYSVNASDTDTADISQLGITVDATASDKVYDATTAATTTLASTGVLSGDTVTFTGTGTFADKNAGADKTVTVTGIAAGGTDAGNYSVNRSDTDTADISPRAITVAATADDKVYDATTAATASLASTGILAGDTVTFTGTGTFDNKNAGIGKTVTVSGIAAGGTDGGNYSVNASDTDTADISQLGITVDATASDKVYDATTAATASLASTGILAGDTVTFTGTGTFADKNVGTGKTVTVSGITASGADTGNYSFNASDTDLADISQLGITVDATASDKVYDGTTAATASVAAIGIIAGDSISFAAGNAAFDDKNVGEDKAVTVTGIAASGADAGNYAFDASADTTADITPATLTYVADPAALFVGLVPAGLTGSVDGLVADETLDEATDGALAWTTPATSDSPAGVYAIDGGGLSAGNYVFVQAPTNATALTLAHGNAPFAVDALVAALQMPTGTGIEGNPNLQPPQFDDDEDPAQDLDIRIVDGGVRLP